MTKLCLLLIAQIGNPPYRLNRWVFALLAILLAFSDHDLSAQTPPTISLIGSTEIRFGAHAQYSALVSGAEGIPVVWSVNGFVGGTGATGTVTSSGVYSPAFTIFAGHSVTISAAAVSAPKSSASLRVKILNLLPQFSTGTITQTAPGVSYLLDVNGSGFVPASQLQVFGQNVATIFISSQELQSNIILPTGNTSVKVGVSNPNAAQKAPVTRTLRVTAAVPPQATITAAARFLDQTSFGPTASSIAHVQRIGLQAALMEQFNQPTTSFSELSLPNSESECPSNSLQCTQSDFFKIAMWGNDQLRQRIAMALSELWVAPVQGNALPFYLNTLANDAFTNYRQIMQDATLSPAMGTYLNMANSGKPGIGQISNENFGREMMQLFSLGTELLNPDGTPQTDGSGNPIPAYTELQVEAFARAYTGWTYADADGGAATSFNYIPTWTLLMVPVESQHDTTAKMLLNGTTLSAGQTAEDDLKGALDNVFAHPNIGPFICKQLIQHLVTGNPSPEYVQRVSGVFADNGNGVRGDMRAIITAIILDPEARVGDAQTGDQADSSPAVDSGHLREPLLWAVNLDRTLGATQINPNDPYPFVNYMSRVMASVGEAPFTQTSVFNYFSPQYAIPETNINSPEFGIENTGTVIPRLTLADIIIGDGVMNDGVKLDLSPTSVIGQEASNPAQLADYLGMLFMHSQMPTGMRNDLITAISAIPTTELQFRAEVAVYLVVTSSEYKVIH